MFLHHPFPGAFGLDIGDLSIKLMQLETRRTFRGKKFFAVRDMRAISLPPGYIVNGEIQQPEMVRKKLLVLLGAEGRLKPIRVPWVVADVPEPKTLLKLLEIDGPPDEVTSDDILFQAKKHFPLEAAEATFD